MVTTSLLALMAAGCGDGGSDAAVDAGARGDAGGACPAGQTCLQPGESYCATEGDECTAPGAAFQALAVTLDAGHIHIARDVTVTFTVRDPSSCTDALDPTTCAPVPGLVATAFARAKGDLVDTTQALAAGLFEDNGDGTYTWTRDFTFFGVNLVGIAFDHAGSRHTYPFPLETSRAGGEDYFCDSDGDLTDDIVAQIRWSSSKGPIHADGAAVAFAIELVRSINSPLNVAMPFRNTMEVIRPGELVGGAPTVVLMADSGVASSVVATLTPTYKGKGIYEVSRSFATGDLNGGTSRTFWLAVNYEDDRTCTANSADREEDYHFQVVQ